MQLEENDNIIPGLNNETISIQYSAPGYRIISKSSQFNSLNRDYRTLTITFGKHLRAEDRVLPVKAIFFATSFKNSFDYPEHLHGTPHITEILLNHHTKVSFNVKMSQLSREKHPDCEEKTPMEVAEEVFVPIVMEKCPNPCAFTQFPKNQLKLCDYVRQSQKNGEEWKPDFDYLC